MGAAAGPIARVALEALAGAVFAGGVLAAVVLGQRALLPDAQIHIVVAVVASAVFAASAALASSFSGPPPGNPALTLAVASRRGSSISDFSWAISGQMAGACAGIVAVQWLLNLDPVQQAPQSVLSAPLLLSEAAGTVLLLGAYLSLRAQKAAWRIIAAAIALFLICWLSPQFAMANPAMTVARTLTSGPLSFPVMDAAAVLAVQLCGALAALAVAACVSDGQENRQGERMRAG